MDLEYLDDPEFQELIRKYLDYLLESLSSLKENHTNGKYTQIQEFGHGLKGTGGGYGFDDLSKLGHKIELAAKEQDSTAIKPLIEQFRKLLNEKRAKYSL